jgi:hypothetical protein
MISADGFRRSGRSSDGICTGPHINAVQATPHFDQVSILDQALRPSDRGMIAHMLTGINNRSLASFFDDPDFIRLQVPLRRPRSRPFNDSFMASVQ